MQQRLFLPILAIEIKRNEYYLGSSSRKIKFQRTSSTWENDRTYPGEHVVHEESWNRGPGRIGRLGSLLVYLFFRKVNKNFATDQPDPPWSEQWTAAEPNVVGRPAKWEFASIITHRPATESRSKKEPTDEERMCEGFIRETVRLADDRVPLGSRSKSIFDQFTLIRGHLFT